MSLVPIPRRLLFARGRRSLYPDELPDYVVLGRAAETGRYFLLGEADRAAHTYVCGVTGSGKSRFLENMIVQDICCQRPLCLVDPTGSLYRRSLEFIAYVLEIAERQGHDLAQLAASYRFLDLDSAANPLRINPLEPQGDETTEEQVDDFLKVAERLFGSIDAMRRIRQNLRNTCWVIAELNRLPPEERPAVEGYEYPLGLRFAARFLAADDEERQRLVGALPATPLNGYVRVYWNEFFARYSTSQQQERLESTWNVLQYFLADSLVSRFFDTERSTLHLPALMRERRSLFCHLPLGRNLKGCQLVGAYLATKLQRAAYRRRPEERSPYSLFIDEFHEFADQEFAKATATLRQYHLRLVLAHQSQRQPPFHTAEGRAILDAVKANCQVKVLFRLSREDAETMTKELFVLSQRRHHFTYHEVGRTVGSSRSQSQSVTFQRSRSTSTNWSRADSVAIAESENYGVAKTEGVTVGRTLTEGFGESVDETISETIARSESETLTEMRSKAYGISVLIGKTWSHLVNHQTGFTFTATENESLAVQRGLSATRTETAQRGRTETSGSDYKVTDSRGNNLVRTQGQVAHLHHAGAGSSSTSDALGEVNSHATSQGSSHSQAIQSLRSIANAIGQSLGVTGTRQVGSSAATSGSETTGDTTGGSQQRSISETDTVSQSRAKLRGVSHSEGRSLTIGRRHEVSLSEAFQQLEQFSRSYSEALTRTVSRTDSIGRSEEEGTSIGATAGQSEATSESTTLTERKVFFTLEGEREITINDLQRLPQRRCVVAKTALAAVELETLTIPDDYYWYLNRNLPAELLRWQARDLSPGQAEGVEQPTTEALPSLVPEPPPNSPWEF